MPLLNYKPYGIVVLGLRWPFLETDVQEQMEILAICRKEQKTRDRMKPKSIELSGAEFLAYCHQYNTLSDTEFTVYRENLFKILAKINKPPYIDHYSKTRRDVAIPASHRNIH